MKIRLIEKRQLWFQKDLSLGFSAAMPSCATWLHYLTGAYVITYLTIFTDGVSNHKLVSLRLVVQHLINRKICKNWWFKYKANTMTSALRLHRMVFFQHRNWHGILGLVTVLLTTEISATYIIKCPQNLEMNQLWCCVCGSLYLAETL